jgi:hypothetical protein
MSARILQQLRRRHTSRIDLDKKFPSPGLGPSNVFLDLRIGKSVKLKPL